MDGYPSNHSQAPFHPWTEHNGWSAGPQPPCDPVPGLRHLHLGSPTHRGARADSQPSNCPSGPPRQQSIPSSHENLNVVPQTSPAEDVHHHLTHNSLASIQGTPPTWLNPTLNGPISPVHPNACAPALVHHGPQWGVPQPMSPCSPHGPQESNSAPFQPLYPQQSRFTGPQSPLQRDLPSSLPVTGPCVNQGAQSRTPEAAFGGVHMASPCVSPPSLPGGCSQSYVSPTSPIQQQPQWALPPHGSGAEYGCTPPSSSTVDVNTMTQSPSSESRYGLDPKLLPSAVGVMAEDRAEWEGKVFVSEPGSPLPPLPTTSCITEDRGCAGPGAVHSISYCVPCEGESALLSHLPLGALLSPLARPNAGERPLPTRPESECMRGCEACGASMCPAMRWQDCGQRFHCPFCGKLSDVPWQHYQPTKGVEGVRVDREQRPELCMGSYEILHDDKDEPAVLLLAIDVSPSALRGGHLEFITRQIRTLLAALKREDGGGQSDVRVGLITYDSRIHLYDLGPTRSRPHMMVVTETEDFQLPLTEGLVVPLQDCIHSVDSVLQLIPSFSPDCDTSSGVPIELPVKTGLSILQAMSCPGKLLLFHSAPLTQATATRSSGFFGSSKPKSIFEPPDSAVSLAKACVVQGCGVELFVLSRQDVGGAWPGHVPYLTGGDLYVYDHLQGEMDRERFSTDLKRTLEAETVYKAQLRIHVSKDLRVSGCYGLFIPGDRPSHVALAMLDQRTTLAAELAHSKALDEERGVVIQVAASYSGPTGQRRTRVHTLTLRCSRHLLDTFRHCQAQTLLVFYCKKMYCAALERPLQELREELQMELTETLACYRKHCSSASISTGQLVLPQFLRALPVYINSLRKSEVLLPGLHSSVHQRLQLRCQVLRMDSRSIATHFYPTLLPLQTSGPQGPAEALRCSAASLEQGGLYLLSGPLALLLWVGSQVPPQALLQVFNTSCFSTLPSGETKPPALENPLSSSLRSLIHLLNRQAPYTRKLWVVKQGDSCEEALQRHLVEDKSPNGGASYADFLYHVHINSVRMRQ